ncbi:MAG: hypothetical protein Q4A52_02455 [Bacillota bacterium]|nr:hypothetical protein [Bacillota bacterium]
MKRLFAIVLVLAMLLMVTACGQGQNPTNPSTSADPTTQSTPPATTLPSEPATKPIGSGDPSAPAEGETMGQKILSAFQANAGKSLNSLEMAELLLKHEAIQFEGSADPIEPGFLFGFDQDITGFKEGAIFAPIIGSIPFVGYVFQLEEGTDVEAFTQNLKDHANLNWLVCVRADEMIVESSGNTVFFLMCRSGLE